MKKYLNIIGGVVCGTVLLISCGEGNQKTEVVKKEITKEVVETCTYSYNNDSTTVHWTAYKHTAKAGVKGKFDEISVEGAGTGAITDVIKGMSFTIPVEKINSKDAARDAKLVKFFFNKMELTSSITGKIVSAKGKGGILTLKMNELAKDIPFDLKVIDNKIELRAEINVEEWNAKKALESLGKACEAKHTGSDGIKKLWPDVSILVTTVLHKECVTEETSHDHAAH